MFGVWLQRHNHYSAVNFACVCESSEMEVPRCHPFRGSYQGNGIKFGNILQDWRHPKWGRVCGGYSSVCMFDWINSFAVCYLAVKSKRKRRTKRRRQRIRNMQRIRRRLRDMSTTTIIITITITSTITIVIMSCMDRVSMLTTARSTWKTANIKCVASWLPPTKLYCDIAGNMIFSECGSGADANASRPLCPPPPPAATIHLFLISLYISLYLLQSRASMANIGS